LSGCNPYPPETNDYFPPVSPFGGLLPPPVGSLLLPTVAGRMSPPPGPWKPYGLGGCPIPAAPLPTVAGWLSPTVAGWLSPTVAGWLSPTVAGWLPPTVAGWLPPTVAGWLLPTFASSQWRTFGMLTANTTTASA
jgi:uncharacterized membrane protein YeaQ/YmgE (transglycosylase-associated protein family)